VKMKKLNAFKCSSTNEVFERMVVDGISVVKCNCGSEANRVISAPKFLGNSTGGNASFKRKRV